MKNDTVFRSFQLQEDFTAPIDFARDKEHFDREKGIIADAFSKIETSLALSSFSEDTANVLRELMSHYVWLLNAAHEMTEKGGMK